MTLEELKKLYAEKGATEARENFTEQGTTVDYIPVQYGDGWSAWEKPAARINTDQGADSEPIYSDKRELGGFSKQEGDYITDYDLNGNPVARRKWNESTLKSLWNDLGPIAMAAGSAYLGGIPLGDTGLTAANALSAEKAIDSGNPLGFVSSISGALDQAGINLDGMSTKDLLKYAGLANTVTGGAVTKTLNDVLGTGSSSNTGSNTSAAAAPQNQSSTNLPLLLSLLGGSQQSQAPQVASQDPYAHIKLMDELFGPNIDLTPAGEDAAKRKQNG